ncbi:hypothetical protein N0V88_007105 [Collariella sp. IMI 366227]|nr:hypothetical protein N0V88_007105 [Collariella sp. IMI 366227]
MDSTTLASGLQDAQYIDILLTDAASNLINEFASTLQTQQQPLQESSKPDVSAQDRRTIGLAAFNTFLQANVTGPVLDEKATQQLQQRFLKAAGLERYRHLRKACLRSLDVDGVSVYEYIPFVELFCLARHVFTLAEQDGVEAHWHALRVHVWHYKLLTQPNLGPGSVFNKVSQWCDVPSLQDVIEKGVEEVESGVFSREGGKREEEVQFMVEKANVCIMLGQDQKAREALRRATELSGFVYALSGALGKRTRFQEKSTSQLVVLAKSAEGGVERGEAKPEALKLNDDTLLENLQFTKEVEEDKAKTELPVELKDLKPDEQPQLSPLDQIILLAEATLKDAFSPADTLTSEEVLPFAVRVISDKSTNWQIYTHALLVRSRIEVHRSRTIERGVLQMQAVVDQVLVDTTQPAEAPQENTEPENAIPEIKVTSDREEAPRAPVKPTSFFPATEPSDSAPAHVRLEHIHALSSPPRWHLESELAYSWAGVGSLVSALEIFKRLRLWAEVALCFASNAAKGEEDEDGRGSGGEARAKAVLRWRLFNKTGTTESAEADEEVDLDDLKEADYHGPERKPAPPNAPRLWCILGDIENDPAYYERAWEISKHRFARAQKSLGEYYLQQKDIKRARDAYKQAVGVNRLSAELWNRLGDISLRLGDFSDASEAFGRAIASADSIVGGDDARTWSNLGSALYSLYVERVKELKKQKEEGKLEEPVPTIKADDEEDEEDVVSAPKPSPRDPATLLTQSLAAYKRGASIAHDNWRIWDNVITLASRLRPLAVADLLLALQSVVRIRNTEDALDIDVLRLLLNDAVLSQEKPDGSSSAKDVYEPGRGTNERAVCEFLETAVVPLITTRSELWELVTRERVWRRDYAKCGRGREVGARRELVEEKEGWQVVVERTDELVSMLENYGEQVPEIGARWKGKARSAVRSVMGKAKESWEGSEEWERLVGLLEGLR